MVRSDLIKYITHTPHNFNASVLDTLLNDYIKNIRQFYKSSNLTKIEDFLYEITYDTIDYSAGEDYFKKFTTKCGDCSAVCVNGIYGRNYDWYYDNTASFIIRTTETETRHASIGVAAVNNLSESIAAMGDWHDLYAILPNLMQDGINDAKVVCNINVAPNGDYGFTTGTNPLKENLCMLGIVRYILDNADSADHALTLLADKNIWAPHNETLDSEFHFMIADPDKCYVVEFIHNKMQIIETNIMTNFYLYNVNFNNDGSVYTPFTQTTTQNAIDTNHITPFGSGLERYNIINSEINNIEEIDDMIALMQSLYYTKTYTNSLDSNTWYTEMTGNNNLTVASAPESYRSIFEITYKLYENRDRNTSKTWQTVHTSIYDIENLTLLILNQEGTSVNEITL